jgi:hypothetical protein
MKHLKLLKLNYVGNNKSVDYKVLVKEMLQTFQNLKCNLKTFFFLHLNYFNQQTNVNNSKASEM